VSWKTKQTKGKKETNMKFKVGDRVKNTPDEIKLMGATWNAVIHKVIGENDSGGCYETVGTWSDEPNRKPTKRQLWGIHLENV
tara:strand:- start:395 stop:643 length:249 start_codon:yes stop_codon:yes gene_type:complete